MSTRTEAELVQELEEAYSEFSYKNNSNLVRGEQLVNLSPEANAYRIREIIRCAQDPIYFAEKYYTIVSPARGKHIIQMYEKQKGLVQEMVSSKRLATLACRQSGKTTSYCIFATHMLCFNADKKILVLANKGATAMEILSRISLAFERLPKWLKPGIAKWNARTLKFSNGCEVFGAATSSDAARGFSCNVLIIDECAFVPPNVMEKLWTSVYPTLSSDTTGKSKVILVSTPNGVGNMFHEYYVLGTRGTLKKGEVVKWDSYRIDWWDVPGRDENWKQEQLASFNHDQRKFDQEFGNSFLGSASTLVSSERIASIKEAAEEVKFKEINLQDYRAKIYKEVSKNRCYVVGVDVADGAGRDFSVVTVFDITTPGKMIEQVAYFASNVIPPSELAYVVAKIGNYYNSAPVMLEANSIGNTTARYLNEIYEYDNIAKVQQRPGKLGIFSNAKIKAAACRNFKKYFDNSEIDIKIYDVNALDELFTFESVALANGEYTYKATGANNDDNVLATVWAFYIFENVVLESYFDIEQEVRLGIEYFPAVIKNAYDMDMNTSLYDRQLDITKSRLGTQNGMIDSAMADRQIPQNTNPYFGNGEGTSDDLNNYFNEDDW